MVRASLFGIGYTRQYLLKLSSTVSRYQFPLTVYDMATQSMYSFSPTYHVKGGTCSLVLTGMLCSLAKQVSQPQFKNHSFCLADNRKNHLRNFFNVPSNPLCPPRSLWWQRIHTSFTIDSGKHIRHPSPIWFLLAALVNINTQFLILNASGWNIKHATKTSLALPLVSVFSGSCPCSIQLITSCQI